MSLRRTAEADLQFILEDGVFGFGWDITVSNPDCVSVDIVGYSNDVSEVIDPDTGMAVSGRVATVALRLSSLQDLIGIPQGIADSGSKPWIVEFLDISGCSYKFKVFKTNPDRTLGIVTCILEPYQ